MANLTKIRSHAALMALLFSTCFFSSLVAAQLSDDASLHSGIHADIVHRDINNAQLRGLQLRAGDSGDSDGDLIPDDIDVDDDNDTIPDDIEGTGDTDNDGVADCLDLDSDNDGITDLYEAAVGSGLMLLLDNDRDGKLDPTVFVGENGLADVVELSTESSTSRIGDADLDGDGIPDHKDLDVDNDGVPDVYEAGGSDENFDGLYDFFIDLNADGLADRPIDKPFAPNDSDQDGIEDFRDLDSDDDGLTDRFETFGEDTDSDGQVDNFVDDNNDGLDDGYQLRAEAFVDSDRDGYPDYRDIDSDGDGITDTEEAFGITPQDGASANSGTPVKPQPDSQDKEEELTLETGNSGSVFGCSLIYHEKARQPVDIVFLLLLATAVVVLLRRRMALIKNQSTHRNQVLTAMTSVALLSSCTSVSLDKPLNVDAYQKPYVGVGMGASFLNADTSNVALDQNSSNSIAGQLTLGMSMAEQLNVEARIADLGEATFTNGGSVGYQVADVSALFNRRFDNVTGLARIGIGALFNDGSIRTTQKNKTHVVVGLGAEYSFDPRLAVRAEWQGHDADVMHSQISVIYRFGEKARRPVAVITAGNEAPSDARQSNSGIAFQAVQPGTNGQDTADAVNAPRTVQAPSISSDSNVAAAVPKVAAPETVVPEPVVPESVTPEVVPKPATPEPAAAKPAVKKPVANQPAVQKPAAPEPEIKEAEKTEPAPDNSSIAATAKTPSETLSQSEEQLALITPEDPADANSAEPPVTPPAPPKKIVAPVDVDQDGVLDASDKCPGTSEGSPVFENGCSMFADSVPGLTFFPDTDRLTSSAENVLDSVAGALADEPDLRVTVAAHTAPSTDPNAAMFLTRRRTIAIIRYLSESGIDATRLRPEAYGDTQPLASAVKPSDNDRVVLSSR